MTHGPPHRILDQTIRGDFAGCEALAPRLEQHRPALCVFGHIHESRGAVIREWEDDGSGRRKRTVYVNAAVQAVWKDRNKEVGPLELILDVAERSDSSSPVYIQKTGRKIREISPAYHRRSEALMIPILIRFLHATSARDNVPALGLSTLTNAW
jgi:hypothetical protein